MTSLTVTPEPRAIRARREPLICLGWLRSKGVIERTIASTRSNSRSSKLSIGLTSYNGRVCYGLNADRDSMKDLFVIGEAIPDALEELLEAHRATRTADRGKA